LLRRASLAALGYSLLLWPVAGLLVAMGVLRTGVWSTGYPMAVARFIADEEEAQASTTPPWFEHRGRRCGEAVWSRMWRLTRSRGASAGEVVGVAAASRFGCRTGKVRAAKER
jgi:hypothetical protein